MTQLVFADRFYQRLTSEVLENRNNLPLEHYEILTRYYRSLKERPERRSFYRYNWVCRVQPMLSVLASLPQCDKLWKVLDAGCGVGTESIFWATLRDDLEVVGVDANAPRLQTAKARLPNYERHLGRALKVRFVNDDVFNTLRTDRFDLVWVMEAISHIEPAEDFLSATADALSPGGYVVISDSNALNPVMAWKILNLRRRGITHWQEMSTETGAIVQPAAERLFSPWQLQKLLRQCGFDVLSVQLTVFFPPAFARRKNLFAWGRWLDRVCSRIPGLRNIGGIYTIVACKR